VPYKVKTAGKGLGATVVGCGVAVGGVCSDESDEHDKRGSMTAMANRKILTFNFGLLLQFEQGIVYLKIKSSKAYL